MGGVLRYLGTYLYVVRDLGHAKADEIRRRQAKQRFRRIHFTVGRPPTVSPTTNCISSCDEATEKRKSISSVQSDHRQSDFPLCAAME